jgi:hypothetical protein
MELSGVHTRTRLGRARELAKNLETWSLTLGDDETVSARRARGEEET